VFASKWLNGFLAASVFAGLVTAADIESAPLLNRLKSRARENAGTLPRFVCRITLDREDYTAPGRSYSCPVLGERDFPTPKESLALKDRANLDVMLSQKSELFAWPGDQSFDADSPNILLGQGFSGSGDFAGFALTVFTSAATTFKYLGACEQGACVRYRYDVPVFASQYFIRNLLGDVAVGYHGTFDVNPETADLINMVVIPTDVRKAISGACDLRTRMTYAKATVEAGVFTIPESTEKLYRADDGTLFRNQISYRGCRQYSAESSISFGDDDSAPAKGAAETNVSLPVRGTRLDLRMTTKIDSERNAAGDPIEAKLDKPVKDSEGHTIPAGTLLRGHLARMENVYGTGARVVMAIRFDEMVLNGKPVRVELKPAGWVDERGRQQFSFLGRRASFNSSVLFHQEFVGPGEVK
jgi:hypothetical protein